MWRLVTDCYKCTYIFRPLLIKAVKAVTRRWNAPICTPSSEVGPADQFLVYYSFSLYMIRETTRLNACLMKAISQEDVTTYESKNLTLK